MGVTDSTKALKRRAGRAFPKNIERRQAAPT
jgi:hypothetical protein